MGRVIRLMGLAVLGAVVVPAVAAAIARRNLVDEGDESSDTVKRYAVFDGVQLASRAASFRGGDAIAWYGGLDLDLREATLDPGGAHLRAMAIFGGARILVPEDWAVEVHGRPFAGGITSDAAEVDGSDGDGRPRLVVDATAVFGGVDISTHGEIEDAIAGRIARARAGRGGPAEAFERAETEAAAEAEAVIEEATEAIETAAEPEGEAEGDRG